MFLCDNQFNGNFLRFQYFNFETNFHKGKPFSKNWSTYHFHIKLPYQKPMLRQIKWWVQNGPIKKNRVLPVTTLFFWKFLFSLRTSYKELIWCANYPNVNIRTFCKRWIFLWRCFFPVSILKVVLNKYFLVQVRRCFTNTIFVIIT